MPLQKETACKSTAYDNIAYIIDREKTLDDDSVLWVETQNMQSPNDATAKEFYEEFEKVNKQFNQNTEYGERKYYHIIINFKNSPSVIPEMVMNVGMAYLQFFYPNHQAVGVVHVRGGREELEMENAEALGIGIDGYHFHGCINSVDMVTGKKVDRTDADLIERKDKVNELAFEMYGIEPFNWREAVKNARKREKEEQRSGKGNRYNQVEEDIHASGRSSELDELRMKILRNAMIAKSRKEFEECMKADGVLMPRNTENTVSFTYKEGKKGTVRGVRLGDYYTAECSKNLID